MNRFLKGKTLSILWFLIALLYSGHLFKTIFLGVSRLIYIPAIIAVIFLIYALFCGRFKFGLEDILFVIAFYMVGSAWVRDAFASGAFYRFTLAVILFAYFINIIIQHNCC